MESQALQYARYIDACLEDENQHTLSGVAERIYDVLRLYLSDILIVYILKKIESKLRFGY